jgi:hypothetical protein
LESRVPDAAVGLSGAAWRVGWGNNVTLLSLAGVNVTLLSLYSGNVTLLPLKAGT